MDWLAYLKNWVVPITQYQFEVATALGILS